MEAYFHPILVANHRPQNLSLHHFGLYQKFEPGFPGISRAQTTPLSAAAPIRFLTHIPEPQIRVPNSAHMLLIAGISSLFPFLFQGPEHSIGRFFRSRVCYTFNIITFLNQQVESFARHHKKLELVILNFVMQNVF
jgi:hypothetical protein